MKLDTFDGFEVHGVKEFKDGKIGHCEQVEDTEAQFWTVYGHYDPTDFNNNVPYANVGVDALIDCNTRIDAEKLAEFFKAQRMANIEHAKIKAALDVVARSYLDGEDVPPTAPFYEESVEGGEIEDGNYSPTVDTAYDTWRELVDHARTTLYGSTDYPSAPLTPPPAAPANKERPYCRYCGSDQIAIEATVYYDDKKAQCEIGEICDKGHTCGHCEGETRLEWRTPTQNEAFKASDECDDPAPAAEAA